MTAWHRERIKVTKHSRVSGEPTALQAVGREQILIQPLSRPLLCSRFPKNSEVKRLKGTTCTTHTVYPGTISGFSDTPGDGGGMGNGVNPFSVSTGRTMLTE